MTDQTGARLRVVRGTPDDVELAALVAGLVAASSDDEPGAEPLRSAWTDRSRQLRGATVPPASGDAWRWSLRG